MTIFLTALTNDKARLIVKEARISHDPLLVTRIIQMWEAEGFIVVQREEN